MYQFKDVTLGADPEIFFIQRGQPKSVEGLVGGTKDEPLQMEGLPEGFCVQEDNVAAEFNIPPAATFEEFDRALYRGVAYISKIAKAHKCKLALVSAMHFSMKELDTPHAQMLGCDPDFNAWTVTKNPRPEPPPSLRTAAGHVHIGWYKPANEEKVDVARAFDVFNVLPSILITEKNERRSLYGKAGACRPKAYGVECRALDNFWIGEKRWRAGVWNNTMDMLHKFRTMGGIFSDQIQNYGEDIQEAINSHNKEDCALLMQKFGVKEW